MPDGAPALPSHPPNPPPLPAHSPALLPAPEPGPLSAPAPVVVAVTGAPDTGVPELAAALRTRLDACVRILVLQHPDLAPLAPAHRHASPLTAARPFPPGDRSVTPSPTLTLLTGLDVRCAPHHQALRERVDAELRAELAHRGLDYRVVYGHGEQRIAQALRAIKSVADKADGTSASGRFDTEKAQTPPAMRRSRPAWSCEKCSDPECEHKLFTSLVGRSEPKNGN